MGTPARAATVPFLCRSLWVAQAAAKFTRRACECRALRLRNRRSAMACHRPAGEGGVADLPRVPRAPGVDLHRHPPTMPVVVFGVFPTGGSSCIGRLVAPVH